MSDNDSPEQRNSVVSKVGDESASMLRFTLTVNPSDEPFPLTWIPIQTAKAVQSNTLNSENTNADDWVVVELAKLAAADDEESIVSLHESDWRLLWRAWHGLSFFRLPMTKEQFEPYQSAFDRFERPAPFVLAPAFGPMLLEIYLKQVKVEKAHEQELRHWVQGRHVVPRHLESMIAKPGEWGEHLGLTLDDLRKFAASLKIRIELENPTFSYGSPEDSARSAELPPKEQRQYLLKVFEELGGRYTPSGENIGSRGALAELVRRMGKDKKTLSVKLKKAAKERADDLKAKPFDGLMSGKR